MVTHTQKVEIWIACGATAIVTASLILLAQWRAHRPVTLQGAVMVQDTDPRKELPITDVEVFAEDDLATGTGKSDATGLFRVTLLQGVRRGQPVTLHFRHPGYRPLDLKEFVGDKIYIVHMVPIAISSPAPNQPRTKVANVRIRYSIKTMTDVNI